MRCLANPPLYVGFSTGRRRATNLLSKESWLCVHHTLSATAAARSYSDLRSQSAVGDGRTRLSGVWVPTGGITEASTEDSHSKLLRAGYLRQAHSGIFHMLPLGRRVQDKLEALIDKYMSKLNASKVSLSSITSEELWTKSGRLEGVGSELFRFKDRKDAGYLLTPTHEEEITSLVASTTTSYKELPLRLYQISRKYRDEKRPRQGLLRSREFIMKDLYTFDYNEPHALNTYNEVREMYKRLFDELKLPYLVAKADSGNMGGKLSHEFHFPTSKGEDDVISCSSCGYVANEEVAESWVPPEAGMDRRGNKPSDHHLEVWRGISQDRKTMVNVWYTTETHLDSFRDSTVNIHSIKSILPDLDSSVEIPSVYWARSIAQYNESQEASTKDQSLRLLNIFDVSVPEALRIPGNEALQSKLWPRLEPSSAVGVDYVSKDPSSGEQLNLLRIENGDKCKGCADGTLKVQKAIELGHTFHLGTRYSEPLGALVTAPPSLLGEEKGSTTTDVSHANTNQRVPMQMGCHGIGVSRIIGAVADTLADEKGLNWPRVMAPYEVVVIPAKNLEDAALEVYDLLSPPQNAATSPHLDVVLDDRAKSFPWKMGDADMIGYPIIVVVGRRWKNEGMCQVQCRRLKVNTDVHIGELPTFVSSLLSQL